MIETKKSGENSHKFTFYERKNPRETKRRKILEGTILPSKEGDRLFPWIILIIVIIIFYYFIYNICYFLLCDNFPNNDNNISTNVSGMRSDLVITCYFSLLSAAPSLALVSVLSVL